MLEVSQNPKVMGLMAIYWSGPIVLFTFLGIPELFPTGKAVVGWA